MSLEGETVWYDVVEVAQTDKAYLFTFAKHHEDVWIPKSQCGGRRRDEDGKIVRVELSTWIVREKELPKP